MKGIKHGYTPDNCRWATASEQQNNKRTNLRVAHQGVVHTVADWNKLHNLPEYWVVAAYKYGVGLDTALALLLERGFSGSWQKLYGVARKQTCRPRTARIYPSVRPSSMEEFDSMVAAVLHGLT